MKIIQQLGSRQTVVANAPRPTPATGQVLIRTAMSALCGSEMHTYRGAGDGKGNFGHEAAGVVEELGEGVTHLEVGQRVGVSAIAGCGNCENCAQGRYTWCANYSFFASMHAEYFVIPALACHILPDDVPWDIGVLITGDGLGVPVHTAHKIARYPEGVVAVFGLGPIGLGNVLLQRHLGRQILAVDRAEYRLELAARLGATPIAAADGVNVPSRIRDLTGGGGAGVCIEAAGSRVTARLCFNSCRTAGLVVFNGEQPLVELSPSEDFIRRDITAVGSWYYHFHEYTEMLDLFRSGLPISQLITHHFPADDAAEAFRIMDNGLSGKIMLQYEV